MTTNTNTNDSARFIDQPEPLKDALIAYAKRPCDPEMRALFAVVLATQQSPQALPVEPEYRSEGPECIKPELRASWRDGWNSCRTWVKGQLSLASRSPVATAEAVRVPRKVIESAMQHVPYYGETWKALHAASITRTGQADEKGGAA